MLVMKRIILSDHASMKLDLLKAHGVAITKELAEETVANPDKVVQGHKGRLIAQKALDEEHVIRIVYEERLDHIWIVTMYPGRRTRYEKDQIQ